MRISIVSEISLRISIDRKDLEPSVVLVFGLDSSKNITFSNHFHIAVNDLDEAIRLTNNLRRWIAPLLALSANSPYFEGIYTKFRSSRTMNFSNFPRTHIPPKINF